MTISTSMILRGSLTSLALLLALPSQAAEITKLAGIAALDYRERSRFPEWSQPILSAIDPLLADRTPSVLRLNNPAGALEVWNSTISAQPGETIALFARPQNAGDWALSATVQNSLGAVTELVYADDGQGADQAAGDGIYSAQWQLPTSHQPALGQADNLMLLVNAQNSAGDTLKAVGGLLYSRPGAVLTGEFRRVIENGNLVVQAQMDVLTAGRYHLAGTIADITGLPLAQAQTAGEFAPGKQWIDMPVYGLIFHELGALAPLKLASVTLTSTNGMPNALGPVLTDAADFGIVPLAQLTNEPFGSADLLNAAQNLEASLTVVSEAPLLRRVRGLFR